MASHHRQKFTSSYFLEVQGHKLPQCLKHEGNGAQQSEAFSAGSNQVNNIFAFVYSKFIHVLTVQFFVLSRIVLEILYLVSTIPLQAGGFFSGCIFALSKIIICYIIKSIKNCDFACRFGKPLVLDMMEVDMFNTVSDRFDEIGKGLMDQIMDKSIMQEEK